MHSYLRDTYQFFLLGKPLVKGAICIPSLSADRIDVGPLGEPWMYIVICVSPFSQKCLIELATRKSTIVLKTWVPRIPADIYCCGVIGSPDIYCTEEIQCS
jgi:hypothetical protein